MKKLTALILMWFCIFGLVGCGSEADELQNEFPEYYNLTKTKGLEVYVWETESGTYSCGVLSGTDRKKTNEEISNLITNGATIEEMKNILASYDIDREEITVIPIKSTSPNYEIDGTDFSEISEVFWGD